MADITDDDRKKAKAFFDRGATVAGTGNYDFAVEMYIMGLDKDPDSVEAHQALRDISLRRKASGGKAMGMTDKWKLKKGDDKQNMLNAEKLLAFDPGNTDHMLSILQNAAKAGYGPTVMWIGPILFRANTDGGKPDFNKYIALKDIYQRVDQWKLAIEACQAAAALRPNDMDLVGEAKNLAAKLTITEGNYGTATNFRDSIKDMDAQRKLIDQDKDVRTTEALSRAIADAEAEWKAQPEEAGKIMKLVEALVKTEDPKFEARAVDILTATYERTKQFRFRMNVGKIKIMQLNREDRRWREKTKKSPSDEALKEEYKQFAINRIGEELKEYTLFAENYPTDLSFKYEMARRLFSLQRYGEAIPILQTARQDPKIRVDATVMLGRSFLEAEFAEEAVDTFRALIEDYQLKGDDKSKEMYYWYARALEQQKENQASIKAYSQVAQWDFNYRDVQQRIKRLRTAAAGAAPPTA